MDSGSPSPLAVTPTSLLGLGLMTAVTGLVDAASLLMLGGVFVANMTGNIVFMGFELAGGHSASPLGNVVALLGFLLGALLGGRVSKGSYAALRRAAFLFVPAFFCVTAMVASRDATPPTSALLAVLALAMGLRNALIRGLAVPDMTTTVLTLTLTGIAADSSLAGGTNPRLGRRIASLGAMLSGAFVGAWLVRFGLVPLLSSVALLELIAVGLVLGKPGLFGRETEQPANAHTL